MAFLLDFCCYYLAGRVNDGLEAENYGLLIYFLRIIFSNFWHCSQLAFCFFASFMLDPGLGQIHLDFQLDL